MSQYLKFTFVLKQIRFILITSDNIYYVWGVIGGRENALLYPVFIAAIFNVFKIDKIHTVF